MRNRTTDTYKERQAVTAIAAASTSRPVWSVASVSLLFGQTSKNLRSEVVVPPGSLAVGRGACTCRAPFDLCASSPVGGSPSGPDLPRLPDGRFSRAKGMSSKTKRDHSRLFSAWVPLSARDCAVKEGTGGREGGREVEVCM